MRPRINRLKQRLKTGATALGVNVQTASPEIVEMVGASGYDYAMLDWEHGSYGFDTLVTLIRAAECGDLTSIVRVPDASPAHIMGVLDAGAHGIVIPQVVDPKEAEIAVRAARYNDGKSGGNRGACPSVRAASHMATDWRSFMSQSNDEVFVALGIECDEALSNFDQLASIAGVDAIFVGAFDWAQSIGCYGDMYHPEMMKRIEKLAHLADHHELPIFATLVSGNTHDTQRDMDMWAKFGARVFNAISDRRIVTLGLAERLNAMHPS